ncbi:hypothetical protein OBBRIDRAFT_738302 [Obba rivulosa]|uniref:Uncharacterized protein n=1 Tax=Obba rivulosa TaxID=1052685 RepID=A0A8E2ALA5_9APHY|nr:hypothetical protein OBBRIDRAFT_738302 [Obba rivulosa]
MGKTAPPKLQGARLVALITACRIGFWLFGCDQGVMFDVVVLPFSLVHMSHPNTVMVGTITALYNVGAVVSAIAVHDRPTRIRHPRDICVGVLGEKRMLILGATVLVAGMVLMGSAMERVQMMVMRVFTGVDEP